MTKLINNAEFKKFLAGGNYQPIPIFDFRNHPAVRTEGCTSRWSDICKILPMDKPQRILDIGCNLGFFGMMAVEAGHIVDGFDADEKLIFWANKIIEEYKIPNIKLWVSSTDLLQNLRDIPSDSYDYVFYLSVHHHICATLGIEESNKVFEEISRIAPNMIFDVGQSNEVDNGWLTWLKKIPQFETHVLEIPQWVLSNSRFKYVAPIGHTISHEIKRLLFFFIRHDPVDVDFSKKIITIRSTPSHYNHMTGYFVRRYLWKEHGGLGKFHQSDRAFPIMDLRTDMASRYYITTNLGGRHFFIKEHLYCWLSPNKLCWEARETYERGMVLQKIPEIRDKVVTPVAIDENMVVYPYYDWPAFHRVPHDKIKYNFFDELLELAGRIYKEIGVFDLSENNILYNVETGEFKLIDFEPANSEKFTFKIFNLRLQAMFTRLNKIFKERE
jgi:SAM-dependent methyltransferase